MPKEKCLIVGGSGRQLDLLRGEASRIAEGAKVDWWIDRAERSEHAFASKMQRQKRAFALACDSFSTPCRDG
jgi:hypothetical protein